MNIRHDQCHQPQTGRTTCQKAFVFLYFAFRAIVYRGFRVKGQPSHHDPGTHLPDIFNTGCRGVAQPGRALPSGGRGRRFESSHPDQ